MIHEEESKNEVSHSEFMHSVNNQSNVQMLASGS